MKFVLFVLWWSLIGLVTRPVAAAEGPECVVCEARIDGEYYWISSAAMATKQSVCKPCHQLKSRCSICTLPVDHRGRQMPDGRYLCPADFKAAILDEREAQRVYEEARRDAERILAGQGRVPGRKIKVNLVDATKLRNLHQTLPTEHDESTILGLTQTQGRKPGEFEHEIHLINGLGPARLAAVAAHEFTHVWIHENVPSSRRLARDSVEGFCELIAYKVMTQRNEEVEKKVILANAYTRGQLNAFIQAESSQQFHRVVTWVLTGKDSLLMETNSPPLLVARTEPSGPIWPPPGFQSTPVPDRLQLRGISGPPARRLALINNATLMTGEQVRVRVGSTDALVRCLEIRDSSVLIQVERDGRAGVTQELFLRSNAGTGRPAASLSGRQQAEAVTPKR